MKIVRPKRSDDDCSRQLHSPVLTDRVHESNLPSTCLIPAPSSSYLESNPVSLSHTIDPSPCSSSFSASNKIADKTSQLSNRNDSRSIGVISGELGGACDLAESNAMDKCQMCGLPNQYGESFDKNVDHLTSPVGRCVCDFTGIKNSNKALSNTINIEMKLTSCSRPMSSNRLTGRVPKSTSSSLRVSELNKSSVTQYHHCWDRPVNTPVPLRGWSKNKNPSS